MEGPCPLAVWAAFFFVATLLIGVLFRLVWVEIHGTGVDWFILIYQGTPSIFPKGHLWR